MEEGKKRIDKAPLDAYLDVLLRANPKIFVEVRNMVRKPRETFEKVFTEAGIIPEWIEQGIEQGKEEVAKNLYAMNMPIEVIAQAVKLPIEKIRILASE